MTQLLAEAADALERCFFFSELNAGHERLQADPATRSEADAERAVEADVLGAASTRARGGARSGRSTSATRSGESRPVHGPR